MNKMITQNQTLKFFSEIKTYFGVCSTLVVLLLISGSTWAQNQGDVISVTAISNQNIANNNPIFYQHAKSSAADPGGLSMGVTSTPASTEGAACSQDNPSNAFEEAYMTSKNNSYLPATDINVPADMDFTLNTITVNIWASAGVTILSADIVFYNDAVGLPGTTKETQAAVIPVSQTVIGSNYGWDISEVVFDITPILLEGIPGSSKVYWVSLNIDMSSNSVGYLESTTSSLVGFEQALSSNNGATWGTNTGLDSVYQFDGECEPASAGGYCGPISYGLEIEPITLVEVAGISNRTSEVINGAPAHEYFMSIEGNMVEGYAYTIILEGNTNGSYTNSFTVFIDWNQDGILDNDTERYNIGTIFNSTGIDSKQATAVITVPDGVTLGSTRMRVIKKWPSGYAENSCADSNYGQAEDYTINITNDGGFSAPYCEVYYFNVEPITLVEVAGISNRSSELLGGSPAHEDFTAIVGNMAKGESYDIALEGNTGGSFNCSFTVFIDWNQDGILDNDTERFEIGSISNSTGIDDQQAISTITVPAGAADGYTRMRVLKKFLPSYSANSCTGTNWGQAEDYTINVTPYCEVDYNIVEPITLVEVAGISNSSSNIINGSPAHEYFTTIVGTMEKGRSYDIALEGNTNGNYTCSFTVFIDWNQDGILDNDTERYEIGSISNSTGIDDQQAIGTIAVPSGALDGPTGMRVLKKYGSLYSENSCADTYFGQAEDYTIDVTPEACMNTYQYPSSAIEASLEITEISTCNFNSDYSEISNVVSGESYEFTSYDDSYDMYGYITVRTGTPSGNLVGSGFSPLTITAPSNDNLFIHWNSDESCGQSGSCVLTTVQCTTCEIVECTNTNSYGSANVSTSGTKTISTCQWFREYATISGVTSGYEYEFGGAENGSGNLAYITVHSGTFDGSVIGVGWSPLSVTAVSNDNLYVHFNSDADCGFTTNCATTTATCISCPIEGIINGNVDWNSNCGDRAATVKLYAPGTATAVAAYDVSIQADGSFSIPDVAVGTFDVIVKVSGYLAKGIQDVEITAGNNSLAVGAILFGDFNNDNIVNIFDFTILADAFLSSTGDPEYNSLVDADCNGTINIFDFTTFVQSLLVGGDTAPLTP